MVVRRRLAVLLVAALTLTATACAAPEYDYVKNSADKTYFKVPRDWHRIDQERLDSWVNGDPDSAAGRLKKQLTWTVARAAGPPP